MANLFKDAKKDQKVTKVSKDSKYRVELKDKEFEKKLTELAKVNEQLDVLSAQSEQLTGEIKPVLQDEFVKLYKSEKKYPGSFNVVSGKASVMFIPTDKYITIDEERSNDLVTQYGEEIVEEKDTYIIDNKMIEKYGEIISKLILSCKQIPAEDKGKIVVAQTKYSVRKGTIQDLLNEKFGKTDLSTLIEDIRPVFQMKSLTVNKA